MRVERILQPLVVVAAALVDSDARILLQKRRKGAEHGGLWEFPGGKVEPGEHPQMALVRELEEELSIAVAESALMPMGFAMTPFGAEQQVLLLLYRCDSWSGAVCNRDADALAWVHPSEFVKFEMPPLDIDLARDAFGVTM